MEFRRLWLALVLACMACSAMAADYSPPLPLDSPLYDDLDRLDALGLTPSALAGLRPVTYAEATRRLTEARSQPGYAALPAPVRARLERGLPEPVAGTESVPPVRVRALSLTAGARHGDDVLIADRRPGTVQGQVSAAQFPLGVNADGLRNPRGGLLLGEARLDSGRGALGGELWLVAGADGLGTAGADTATFARQARGAVMAGPIEISAGFQSLWWGPGRHGSLLLSNNAHPLPMLRLTNPQPHPLPGPFSILGPLRFDLFISRLEHDRVVPEPYFSGLRLALRPARFIEIGFARTMMFGGEGRPAVNGEEFFTILSGRNLTGKKDTSNQLAALDLAVTLASVRLYAEMGGEDEADAWISNHAFLFGVYLPQLGASSPVSLRLEYADLSHIDANSPLWYRHGIYRSGYTYRHALLGHHVGGGGRDYLAEVNWELRPRLSLSAAVDFEERRLDQPQRERHLQPSLTLNWHMTTQLNSRLRLAYDRMSGTAANLAAEDELYDLALLFERSW